MISSNLVPWIAPGAITNMHEVKFSVSMAKALERYGYKPKYFCGPPICGKPDEWACLKDLTLSDLLNLIQCVTEISSIDNFDQYVIDDQVDLRGVPLN